MRKFEEYQKLNGRKNFQQWKRMVELDLSGLKLIECISTEGGSPEWDEEKKRCRNARALMYLQAAVTKNIAYAISKATSPFQAMKIINDPYRENETLDNADLIDRMFRLVFKPGYSQQRYVNDFEDLMSDISNRGLQQTDAFRRILFMKAIVGIKDHNTPFST